MYMRLSDVMSTETGYMTDYLQLEWLVIYVWVLDEVFWINIRSATCGLEVD